jgi:hypothetical protein
VPWYRLSERLVLLNLDGIRYTLRLHNLRDTEIREAPPKVRRVPGRAVRGGQGAADVRGTWNDLSDREVGAVGPPPAGTCRPICGRKRSMT